MGRAASFKLEAVSVAFNGGRALDGVDLAVAAGEAVAIVGPSGSGKTTLLRLLNGTVRPNSGAIYLNEVDLAALSPPELRQARARVGFVHQDHSLVPNLRVAKNVIAGKLGQRGFLRGARSMLFPPKAELEHAFQVLERVGIPDKIFHRTDTLSGGEQQRVAVARALYQEPAALLADEPVASVDPTRARDVIELLCSLAADRGLTLIVSLHDLEIARYFPRTVGLRDGRVQFDQPTGEVSPAALTRLYRLESSPSE